MNRTVSTAVSPTTMPTASAPTGCDRPDAAGSDSPAGASVAIVDLVSPESRAAGPGGVSGKQPLVDLTPVKLSRIRLNVGRCATFPDGAVSNREDPLDGGAPAGGPRRRITRVRRGPLACRRPFRFSSTRRSPLI